jgi:hypothetical protein
MEETYSSNPLLSPAAFTIVSTVATCSHFSLAVYVAFAWISSLRPQRYKFMPRPLIRDESMKGMKEAQ